MALINASSTIESCRLAHCQWQATTIYDDVSFATEPAPVGGVGARLLAPRGLATLARPVDAGTTPINLVALSKLREQCKMKRKRHSEAV